MHSAVGARVIVKKRVIVVNVLILGLAVAVATALILLARVAVGG